MTGERTKFESYQKKLQNICDENNLTYRFLKESYPITLKIMPVDGMDGQLTMLENADDTGFISPNAFVLFFYSDGNLQVRTSETFAISDALFSKLKNLYKNMHSLFLQFFFRDVVTKQLLTAAKITEIANAPAEKEGEAEEDTDGQEEDGDGEEPEGTAEDSNAVELPEEDPDMPPDEYDGDEPEYADTLPMEAGLDDEVSVPALDDELELIEEAKKIVIEAGSATVSLLQKRLGIGYAKGASLMERLENLGVVGPLNGPYPREVLASA